MRIYDLPDLERTFDRTAILQAVRSAFVTQHRGEYVQASPVHLTFQEGDCHIKSGFAPAGETILIKVATGFYRNSALGLSNSDGLMLLLDQRTGRPKALLRDEGMLTAWRTVAATVVAAQLAAPSGPLHVGIVGTGLQARLSAEWISAEFDVASMQVWGRSADRASSLAAAVGAAASERLEDLCRSCNLIITQTPSTQPLVLSDWIQAGTHIVGVGADTPGKVEIDPAILARAAAIFTDDHHQCLDHGDFGAAVRAGAVADHEDVSIGKMLADDRFGRLGADEITFADLTGLSVQDAAIAKLFLDSLSQTGQSEDARG